MILGHVGAGVVLRPMAFAVLSVKVTGAAPETRGAAPVSGGTA